MFKNFKLLKIFSIFRKFKVEKCKFFENLEECCAILRENFEKCWKMLGKMFGKR
jgi:hypothetical protein